MQAIVTHYLGPTDRRGSRVKATAQVGSMAITWDDALDSDDNHRVAAEAFARKMGWLRGGVMHSGVLPNGDHCHVIAR